MDQLVFFYSKIEAGVRVAREDPITGDIAFSCHGTDINQCFDLHESFHSRP